MKNKYFKQTTLLILALALFTTGCTEINPARYTLELPDAPETWVSLLGKPHWRIEWFDPDGNKQSVIILPDSGSIEIEIPVTLANPVIAWPFWPDRNLEPGLFKPAGALFPFDVKGAFLFLSWEAGVDASFYMELAQPAGEAYARDKNYIKIPTNFDWLRFRDLFKGDTLNGSVQKDPWLVNWRFTAEKTISGNFDTRRLVPEETQSITIPLKFNSVWHGASPFEQPLEFKEDEYMVLKVRPGINIWVTDAGILKISGNTWVFIDM